MDTLQKEKKSRKKSKIWQQALMYISSNLEQQEGSESRKEAEELNDEMYSWLQSNFNISHKKRTPTIFDLMKK